jgi:hypothetical protein
MVFGPWFAPWLVLQGDFMNPKIVTVPELAMIAGPRMALGAGIGLLVADRLSDEQRRAVGWTLLGVGAISTFPLAAEVMFGHEGGSQKKLAPAEVL